MTWHHSYHTLGIAYQCPLLKVWLESSRSLVGGQCAHVTTICRQQILVFASFAQSYVGASWADL